MQPLILCCAMHVQEMGDESNTAQVHPALLTEALVKAAEGRGAQLRRGIVQGIDLDDDKAVRGAGFSYIHFSEACSIRIPLVEAYSNSHLICLLCLLCCSQNISASAATCNASSAQHCSIVHMTLPWSLTHNLLHQLLQQAVAAARSQPHSSWTQ